MINQMLAACTALAALALPLSAIAQSSSSAGTPNAIATAPSGPLKVIASDQTLRFGKYVMTHNPYSFRFEDKVRIGAVLSPDGPAYYPVPAEYGATEYVYSVVNGHAVLVDPRRFKIVQIVN
jgi:hypothetical protein